ncbi:MAG TPA: bacillithiol biosynthesis cysteine-adding enzyme BshC [Terriglobales bacterium]|nr:bacillithiol biosynthesis cysteine-adding enzyme BshC [Terriglobales bacterium]
MPTVKAQCLPFRQIPHTTRLFSDYLSWSPSVQPFYSRPPRFADWIKDETAAIRYDSDRRQRVAAILQRQNQSWGGSAKTLENIERLRGGASAVVTGQQVGLFGGPFFSLFKALSTLKLAREATAAGCDSVPVFWLATTDHDLEEIRHVSILGPDGTLQNLATSTQGIPDAPVGTVTFGPEIEEVVEAAAASLGGSSSGDSEITGFLREAYRPGQNFGNAFARLFSRLFADWGVVLLDASDPELHQIAQPIYQAAIEHAAALDDALLARGRELEAAGYHQQVKVTPSSTLLFTLRDGARIAIHRRSNGAGAPDFLVADEKISLADMQRQIASEPQRFNPNVLLRPVVQDYLLPTLAYVGGAAEVAYFGQAAVVYQALLGRVTPILPRFSATVVEAKPQSLLERYGLAVSDVFNSAEGLRERLAKQALPAELQSAFDQAESSLEKSLVAIKHSLERLDKTLVEAAGNAGSKMRHQLEQLRSRAARAELRQSELLSRHAELLSNALYPNKVLQERDIAGVYFVLRYGPELLQDLYDTIHTDCLDHQIISLSA